MLTVASLIIIVVHSRFIRGLPVPGTWSRTCVGDMLGEFTAVSVGHVKERAGRAAGAMCVGVFKASDMVGKTRAKNRLLASPLVQGQLDVTALSVKAPFGDEFGDDCEVLGIFGEERGKIHSRLGDVVNPLPTLRGVIQREASYVILKGDWEETF